MGPRGLTEKQKRFCDFCIETGNATESISQFGFRVPIVIDKDNNIVCGHKTLFVVTQDCLWSHNTRWKACKKLKIDTVPCVVADDLTETDGKHSQDKKR